jgi:hypothetical protein
MYLLRYSQDPNEYNIGHFNAAHKTKFNHIPLVPILTLFSYLSLGLQGSVFLSGCPNKTAYSLLALHVHITQGAHLILLIRNYEQNYEVVYSVLNSSTIQCM